MAHWAIAILRKEETEMTSINSVVAKTLNSAADVTGYAFEKTKGVIVPAAWGALGGWVVGVGAPMGAFQGAVMGGLHSTVVRPLSRYMDAHTGQGADEIHPNACAMLKVASVLVELALPILVTAHFGYSSLLSLSNHLPGGLGELVHPGALSDYTPLKGIFSGLLPLWALR